MILKRHSMLIAASAASLAFGTLAHANSADAAAPATPDASSPAIAEIVVTAEKRSGTVQTTPIAIVAVSGAELKSSHVTETSDLASVVPNLQIVPVAQTFQINIRGVGSNFFDPRAETSVAQSIDGFYYSRPPQSGGTFFDLNRVEVLKGPQGTLYGTNSAAGAVNLVTNHPTDHLEASAEVGFGNYAEKEYAAMVNVPLSDDLAVRVAGKGFHHDGYIANYYDDAGDDAFRVSAQWKPSNQLTVYAAYNFSNFSGHGAGTSSYPCESVPYTNIVSAACAPPGAASGTYALNGHTSTRMQTAQLNIDYDVGFANLTSVSGYMTQYQVEADPNGTFFTAFLNQHSHDYSEEIRLAGKDNARHQGGLAWVVGGNVSKGDGSQTFTGLGTFTLTNLPQTLYAFFGQVSYGLTDTIRATGGLRYSHDHKGSRDNLGSDININEGRLNYRAELETDLAPHNLLFASISSGYVAGGVDAGVVGLPLPPGVIPPTFLPETITAYEIGSKNTFFDGKLRLNFDFYYYDIKNFQSYDPGFIDTFAGGPALQLQNIGNVKTYGAEVDGAVAITPQDRLTFSGSLATGHFGAINLDTFAFGPMGPFPTLISVPAGYPLPNLPHWDVRLGYTHSFELGNGSHLDATVNTHISGSYWTVPASTDPLDKQASYMMTDASLSYTAAKYLVITAWIKNIENKAVNNYEENPGFHLYYPSAPRTFGGTIGVKF